MINIKQTVNIFLVTVLVFMGTAWADEHDVDQTTCTQLTALGGPTKPYVYVAEKFGSYPAKMCVVGARNCHAHVGWYGERGKEWVVAFGLDNDGSGFIKYKIYDSFPSLDEAIASANARIPQAFAENC